MKIAAFGQTGQVGTEMARRVPDGVTLEMIGRDRADFMLPDVLYGIVRGLDADVIVNAAAYTQVDRAETDADIARLVNATAVRSLAAACQAAGKPLVHVSTDYVFDGSGETPRKPGDPTGPLGVYGQTKLAGEEAIREIAPAHAILRTSWVFSAHGGNFVKTMLRLGATRDRLTIVADQVGGPTPAAAIADALFAVGRAMADGHQGGTYHFSGAPEVSWADFAREIFRQAGLGTQVADIPTSDYPTPAARPLNSRLDCTGLAHDFGIPRPDWRGGLAEVLKELGA